MKRPSLNPWLLAALLGGVAYPFVIYWGQGIVPPTAFACFGLGLLGIRIISLRRDPNSRLWQIVFLLSAAGLLLMLFISPAIAVKAYPVMISLSVATVFVISLIYPPTVIERFARLAEPDLPEKGVAYTRKVTVVWVVFLFANAAVSTGSAVFGTTAEWTLWNGCLSYICMGLLFLGEFTIRHLVRRAGQ